VHLPESERAQLGGVRSLAGRALREAASRLGLPLPPEVTLVFHPTVEAYTRATRQPWWTAARTNGTRIDLLPLGVLNGRGTLDSTLRHEFVHLLAEPALMGRALWIREGLAVVMAGELTGAQSEAGKPAGGRTVCPSDADLRASRNAEAWRRAYEAAGRCVARALADGRRWQDLR
jgi:hypothetical protein